MGHKPTYHPSWDIVFEYLDHPNDHRKHSAFYTLVAPLIKHWLLRFGFRLNLEAHARSIFADLYLKERKRREAGKLRREQCTAKATTYYFPVIRNMCMDYQRLLQGKLPASESTDCLEVTAEPSVFESLWGDYKKTILKEMRRCIQDWIELSRFEALKKEYLRQRFLEGLRFLEILKGLEKTEFEAVRKWICRQGKKIADTIAKNMLPAIIDCYQLPISKEIDPKIIEKHLLGSRVQAHI
ncbi:hypothetical protein FK220_006475 [Flavobacteriaceae bacterium TP-CH-4]|uniref:Uncharacterized protein n=1 Tax=Pelagihabitans pacificus TaxID=2696054 RepID=A0A967AYN5_9FLAO|nr:hypothetical protein [Pelagihabitans pacificus]NHF58976.1 hypothetical protein [Pelagihabitans pacificus]